MIPNDALNARFRLRVELACKALRVLRHLSAGAPPNAFAWLAVSKGSCPCPVAMRIVQQGEEVAVGVTDDPELDC